MRWNSRGKRNSVSQDKSSSKSSAPADSQGLKSNAENKLKRVDSNQSTSQQIYAEPRYSHSNSSISSNSYSNLTQQTLISSSESYVSSIQTNHLTRTQSIATLANDSDNISVMSRSFKNLKVSSGSSSKPFTYDNYDDTVLKTGWINKGSNINNWNNVSSDSWKIYKAELKGATLSLYKLPSDFNIKSFDPQLNNTEPGSANLRQHRLSSVSSRSNLKNGIKSPPIQTSPSTPESSKASKVKLKYRSEVYPHPDLEMNQQNSIVSGSLESVCHTIIFNTLNDDKLSYNLLLILPLFGDMKESLKYFIEYSGLFTSQRQVRNSSSAKIQISANTDYAITQRLGLVVSTVIGSFPGMLLDDEVSELLDRLILGISQHDDHLTEKLKTPLHEKSTQMRELTSFRKLSFDPNGSLSLTDVGSFLQLDAQNLAHQINTIDLKFCKTWNPENDPSLLYELENFSYTRLNPLIFNSSTDIHYLGRLLVNHLFGSNESKRSPLKRAQIISKWIQIGCVFDKIGDMVSWLAIATTICSVPILRLKKSWSLVDDEFLKVISTEWAPVIFELDRRTMISEASHRSSYHVIAPQGLGVSYSKNDVVPYFGDLAVKFVENSTLKNCEKRVQRVRVSFNRWDEYLNHVCEDESLTQSKQNLEDPELIKQLFNALSNHVQLPPLTQFSVMELSLSTESDIFCPNPEHSTDSRTPLITGSYLPTLFSEITPYFRLFNQEVLIGASGFPTPLTQRSREEPEADEFEKITGVNDIDTKTHQLNQNLPRPSKQQTLLKSVRDIFNIGSDLFHVDDALIFKSYETEDLRSSRPVSAVLENPSSKRLSKISSHRLSQFSESNRTSTNSDHIPGDELDVFAGLDSPGLLNSFTKSLNVVLKAGTFDRMVDVLVLTSNIFSRRIDRTDIDNYSGKSNLLDNQFLKLKMDNGVYTSTFFSTYRSFASTSALLEALTKRFVGARSCALSIQRFNENMTSAIFPNWFDDVPLDEPGLNWKYVGKIQVGVLEALLILVNDHYNDFTDDLKNKELFVELLKLIDNDIVTTWKETLASFEKSMELNAEMDEIYNALSNLYKKIRKSYIKKCYRPLDLFPKNLPNTDDHYDVDIKSFDLPCDFREAEVFVDELDKFLNEIFQKTSISDWNLVFQILEMQSSKSLTSLFKYKWKPNKDEKDLEILNIYSWIENLFGDNIEDTVLERFPPTVKLLFNVHSNLEKLFKLKISDVGISQDARISRMASILQMLTISKLRMRAADLFNSSPKNQLSPRVPSFIQTAIVQAIVSPESRLFVDSWTHAVSSLQSETVETIDQVSQMLPHFDTDDLSDGLRGTLTPCIGWFVERLLEISNYVPNMSIENSKLINFDKRRFVYNCISNIVDMKSKNEDDLAGDETINEASKDIQIEFSILYKLKHFKIPELEILKELSKRENTDNTARLFKPLIALEIEKIARDSKKKETLENQERDIKRTQLLSRASASLSLNREIPAPNEQQTQLRKGRQSSSSSQVSPSKVSGVGKRLGGLFKSVRPFSISVSNTWSGPDKIVHPNDLPNISNIDLSGKYSRPYQQIQMFKYKPLFVHSNIEGFFKIVSEQGGEEFFFQATSNQEAQSWVSTLNLSKRYSYLSKDSNGLTSSKVFGVPIVDVCEREGTVIPTIVERLLQEIEVRGLDETGLYRIPGSVGSINLLKKAFDEGGDFTLEDDRWFEVNTLAGCFKSYLRELPESLFTSELLPEFVEATKHGDLTQNLSILVRQLPVQNYHLLKRLFEHLNKVLQHSENNRMDAVNLAIVFSMSFLNNDLLGASMGSDLGALQSILQHLVKDPESVFNVGPLD